MEWKVCLAAVLLLTCVKAQEDETDSMVRMCFPESLYHTCLQMADEVDGVQCIKARDRVDCMRLVQSGEADTVNLDGQDIYVGGKYFGLSVVAYESVDGDPFRYEAVALVQKNSSISSLSDLKDKRSCHTGVGRNAGWQIPVAALLERGVMTPDCRGELYTVSNFFNSSCASGNWSPDPIVDAELKKRHPSLCAQCQHPEACSVEDELYNGYQGAIECLLDDVGDVAFTSMTAVRQKLEKDYEAADRMQLFCLDGSKKSVQDEEPCTWGRRPSNAYTISAEVDEGNRTRIYNFLKSFFDRYPAPHVRRPDWFGKVIVSKNDVTSLHEPREDQRSWEGYLGDYRYTIDKKVGSCDEDAVRFCVTSDAGRRKCEDFAKVARSRRLTPSVECVQTDGKTACMQTLKDGHADIYTLDGGDVYKGGRYFDLQPVVAELYGETDASYYAVAAVKNNSDVTRIQDLKDLKSCHTGIGRTAGWIIPIGTMVSTGQFDKSQACNAAEAFAQYFSGSCVPGANDPKLNPDTPGADKLCQQCIGDENGDNKCRGPAERYSGYAGALRCLAEDAGQVAFVKHVTVPQYTDDNSDLDWARNLKSADFALLCLDNTVADVTDYLNCHLAKVPSHYVMLTGGAAEDFRLKVARLLAGAGRYFGPKSQTFRLFGTYGGAADLLFKDSTTNVRAAPLTATYRDVLGEEYYKAVEAADPRQCDS